jgi:hypothetical protein
MMESGSRARLSWSSDRDSWQLTIASACNGYAALVGGYYPPVTHGIDLEAERRRIGQVNRVVHTPKQRRYLS